MKTVRNFILLSVFLFVLISFSFSLSCLALAGGYDINAVKGQEYYFDFTVYNNDADITTVCDTGLYSVTLTVKNEDIDKLFSYKITDDKITLKDTETKRVMLSLTPLVESGKYDVLLIVTRSDIDPGASGTKIVNSTVGKIKINLGGEQEKTNFDNPPTWYSAEQTAKEIDLNKQKELQPEPESKVNEPSNNYYWVIIVIMALVIIILLFFVYKGQVKGRKY